LDGIEFNAEELELRGGPQDFERLKVKTQLIAECKRPLEGALDGGERDIGCEDFEKIVEIMTHKGG
jgi:hypothetical protein